MANISVTCNLSDSLISSCVHLKVRKEKKLVDHPLFLVQPIPSDTVQCPRSGHNPIFIDGPEAMANNFLITTDGA